MDDQLREGSSASSSMDHMDMGEISPVVNRNQKKRVFLDQERFLPIANIARIMKKMIPSSGKVSKDAKECVQECVSEFISFLSAEAVDRCKQEKRKTINGDDMMKALINLGFDDYIATMEIFVNRYRSCMKFAPPRYTYPMSTLQTPSPTIVQNHPSPNVVVAQQPPMTSSSPVVTSQPVAPPQTVYVNQQPETPPQSYRVVTTAPADPAATGYEQATLMIDPNTKQCYVLTRNSNGDDEYFPVQVIPEDGVSYTIDASAPSSSNDHPQPVVVVSSSAPPLQPSTSSSTRPSALPIASPLSEVPKLPRDGSPGPVRITRSAARAAQGTPYSKNGGR